MDRARSASGKARASECRAFVLSSCTRSVPPCCETPRPCLSASEHNRNILSWEVGSWPRGSSTRWIEPDAPAVTTSTCEWVRDAASAGSCRIGLPDTPGNLGALLPLNQADVILTLQVQLELNAVPEITAEPHGGIGRDR